NLSLISSVTVLLDPQLRPAAMEEYLANMRTLRSYMNDLEEEAAKRSAEEQRQRTAIDAHDSDIALVRAQAKQVSDEAEHLAKARAHVCVEMAEKQGRIASLEVVGATLKQVRILDCSF
uniref:Uncharacterized protein n=1 Tax=Aegilops tauschii subsp. strangulata TaxID=200361 RepID=A0A453RTS2_AEGTS